MLFTYYLQVRYYGATSGGLNQQRTGVILLTLEIIIVKQGIVHFQLTFMYQILKCMHLTIS